MLLALLLACGSSAPTAVAPSSPAPPAAVPPAAASAPAAPAPAAAAVRVVFLGDSLTAGLGLGAEDAYPARLGRAWTAAGLPVEVVNAGVSGDTTAGGLRRLDWLLAQHPDLLVVALGANDMLRGLPVEEVEANLRQILARGRAAGADVALLGMRANPTLGPDYVTRFDAVYPRLAEELGVPLLPFLLDGVAGVAALNQADGIHPTAEGQAKLEALVAPLLTPVVRARVERRAAAP